VLLNKLYEFNSVLLIAFVSLFLFSLTSDLNQFPSTLAEKSSDNINTLINKALALGRLGDHTQAIQYFDKVLAIDPRYVAALGNKGLALDTQACKASSGY
jgi:tetratricopeptide (TPR) repeat protein